MLLDNTFIQHDGKVAQVTRWLATGCMARVRSGGVRMGDPLLLHLPGNCSSKNVWTMLAKCGGVHLIFFLWGFVKDQVYRTPVSDLVDSHERIVSAVNNVTQQMIQTHGLRLNTGWTFSVSLMEAILSFMEHEIKKFSVFNLCSNWFHL